jgi:hypothetical protein
MRVGADVSGARARRGEGALESMGTDDLVAIERIRQLKARYCRLFDTKQWDRLRAVFTPDARLEGFSSMPDGSGVEVFLEVVSRRLAPAITIHHVQAPEIKLLGPDKARGIWSMSDYVDFPPVPASSGVSGERGWRGWAWYEEEYEESDGAWRISFMRLVRQRMDALPADAAPPKPGRLKPSLDWL